jgi:hypothetical protein
MTTFPKGTIVILTAHRPGKTLMEGFVSLIASEEIDAGSASSHFIAHHEDILRQFPELVAPGNPIGFVVHILPGDGMTYMSTAHLDIDRAMTRATFAAILRNTVPVIVGVAFGTAVPLSQPLDGTPMANAPTTDTKQ